MDKAENKNKYNLEVNINEAIEFHNTWFKRNNILNSITAFFNLLFSVAILPILLVIFYLPKQSVSTELFNYIGISVSSIGILFAILSMSFKYGIKAAYHLSQKTWFEKIILEFENGLISEQKAWNEYFKAKEQKEP